MLLARSLRTAAEAKRALNREGSGPPGWGCRAGGSTLWPVCMAAGCDFRGGMRGRTAVAERFPAGWAVETNQGRPRCGLLGHDPAMWLLRRPRPHPRQYPCQPVVTYSDSPAGGLPPPGPGGDTTATGKPASASHRPAPDSPARFRDLDVWRCWTR